MNRFCTALAVAAIAGSALAQGAEGWLGKSCEEILAMSPEQWTTYYTQQKADSSEASQDAAARVYGSCLKERNDAAVKDLQAPDRDRILKYKELYVQFRQDAIQVQSLYAGGGTMYTHASARAVVADESLFYTLILINTRPVDIPNLERRMRMFDLIGWIRKRLGENGTITEAERKDLAARGVAWKDILTVNRRAMTNFDKILPLLPRERQAECVAVLEYYWHWLTTFDPKPGE